MFRCNDRIGSLVVLNENGYENDACVETLKTVKEY